MGKFIIVLAISLVCSQAYAIDQFTAKQHKAQLQSKATDKGAYAQYDRWPKDYFLIPQNLPFMVGLALYHPGKEVLALSEEQNSAIHMTRNQTVPAVLVLAGAIKKKELELVEKFVDQGVEPHQLYYLVDEIASMRADLTKAHMVCIEKVQNILDAKQYAALLKLAATVTKHKNPSGKHK